LGSGKALQVTHKVVWDLNRHRDYFLNKPETIVGLIELCGR